MGGVGLWCRIQYVGVHFYVDVVTGDDGWCVVKLGHGHEEPSAYIMLYDTYAIKYFTIVYVCIHNGEIVRQHAVHDS